MKCKQLPLCDDNLCVRELLLYISETLLEPMPIKVFKNRKPVLFDDVWAGGLTTFARARETGHIYAFGLNNYNQLGKRKICLYMSPGHENSLWYDSVDCFCICILYVRDSRKEWRKIILLISGDEDTNMKFQPVLLKNFKGKKWLQVSGGQHHR